MKLWAQNDTTSIEKRKKKKIKIIENATIGASYDLMRDSMNLSNFSISGRTRLFKSLSLNFRAVIDPYSYDNGNRIDQFRWNNDDGKIATLTSSNLALSYRLKSKKTVGSKNLKNVTEDQQDEFDALSDEFVDFTIPWSVNISYNLVTNRTLINTEDDSTSFTQSIRVSGDIGLTKKWKIGINTGFDFKARDFNYTTVSIYRDMHCWEGSFNWVPFGTRKSYTLTINVKAALLKDLRIQRKRAWYDNVY